MSVTQPAELVVYDDCEPCPYLSGRTARMPLRAPVRPLTGDELDRRMAAGDRRTGAFLYRTSCPSCRACEPIRVAAGAFRPTSSQQRVRRRGDRLIEVRLGPAIVDDQRIELFNNHRNARRLNRRERDVDQFGYLSFLVESCSDTFELRYYLEGRLIAVAVCDRGERCINAVYTYFDPAESRLSPGVYSVLKQIELCRAWGLEHLYLGLYVAESPHMSYKDRYRPHQRLIQGRWLTFE